MSLMCGCDYDYCPDPGSIVYQTGPDYSTLKSNRRQRCTSCKKLINIGALVMETHRYRVPDGDIEERIYGEDGEIPRASAYMCEACSDIFFSLEDIGYCISPYDNQRRLLDEHNADKSLLRSIPKGVITHGN